MAEIPIYIELSDDVAEIMADNRLSIEDILHQEGIDATVSSGMLPVQTEEGARSKDIVTIVTAGSILISAIAFAISKVISAIANRPQRVEYDELVELRDAEGNIITDDYYGKPLFKRVKRVALLTPAQKSEFEATFDPANGITMKISSEQEEQTT